MTATEETNNVATTEKAGNTRKERSTSRHIIVLASGDLLAFLAFSAIGRGSHGEATGLAAIPAVIVTAAPFAIAWFIVSPFIGVYRRELVANPRKIGSPPFIPYIFSSPLSLSLLCLFFLPI